jgi:hypothetical protein
MERNELEDLDVRLQNASKTYIREAKYLIPRALWKHKSGSGQRQVHRYVRKDDVDRITEIVCSQEFQCTMFV